MINEPEISKGDYLRPSAWSGRLTIGRLAIGMSLSKVDLAGMTTPKSIVYNHLSALRTERGMSRQELAQRLNISYQTVVCLERGNYSPSLELAFRISECFRLPVETIFSYI